MPPEKQDICQGTHSLPSQIRLCCDARQQDCKWFVMVETDAYKVPICTREQMQPDRR
jgi:hypothetical protein